MSSKCSQSARKVGQTPSRLNSNNNRLDSPTVNSCLLVRTPTRRPEGDIRRGIEHTTRAAITGLRKRGYAVIRGRIGAGESVYRIPDTLTVAEIVWQSERKQAKPAA